MEAINWEAVQAVAEMLGLVFIVGSLIFVGFQIRQNALATRAASMNSIMGSWSDLYMRLGEGDTLADVVWNGLKDPSSVTGVGRYRFSVTVTGFFHTWHNAYYQWTIGTYESEAWSAQAQSLINFFTLPGVRVIWSERKGMFPIDFRRYIETEIIEGSPDANYHLAGI